MVLGVPLEAVSSWGTGPASFATGRGVIGGALGWASDAEDSWGAGVLAGLEKMDLGVWGSHPGQKLTLSESRDKVQKRWERGKLLPHAGILSLQRCLQLPLCSREPQRSCESPGRARL